MVNVNAAPSPSGEDTGAPGKAAHPRKLWNAPRLVRLDGRSAMTGFGGLLSDNINHTSASVS
jgi:hypothetical protein